MSSKLIFSYAYVKVYDIILLCFNNSDQKSLQLYKIRTGNRTDSTYNNSRLFLLFIASCLFAYI